MGLKYQRVLDMMAMQNDSGQRDKEDQEKKREEALTRLAGGYPVYVEFLAACHLRNKRTIGIKDIHEFVEHYIHDTLQRESVRAKLMDRRRMLVSAYKDGNFTCIAYGKRYSWGPSWEGSSLPNLSDLPLTSANGIVVE